MSLSGRTGTLIPASSISDVPNSLVSLRQMRAMPSRNQIIQLAASNGASQNDTGVVSFNIGCGAGQGYLKAGSAYLQFEFTPTLSAGTTDFNGTQKSAQAVIRSLNVNIGGLQVEMVQDYNHYARIIEAHCANANYVERDASITSQSSAMASATTYVFCIPILSGLLQQEQHLPLWLLNSQLQIQLNLASAGEALYTTGGTATSFTVANPVLVYEKIFVDGEFEMAVRQKLAQGGLYELPFYSAMSYRSNASAGTFSQNIGVNLTSLSSCLWAHIAQADVASSTAQKLFITNNPNTKAGSDRVVRVDGSQLVQHQVYDPTTSFMEMQRAVGSINDVGQTTVATKANWTTDYFVNGQSAERFSDADLTMRGRSCNNAVIEEKGVAASSVVFLYLVYCGVLIIDAQGGCVISK
jgi:hypothetical protein